MLEDLSRMLTHCYEIGKGIFVIELIIVGTLMLYYTSKFSKLVGEVSSRFGVSFMDEKNQLRCALGVFLSTYLLRSVIKGVTVVFSETYSTVQSNNALIIEASITFVQLIYDVLPLLIIVHQHHSAFAQQERGPTSTTYTRDYTAISKSHATMVSNAHHMNEVNRVASRENFSRSDLEPSEDQVKVSWTSYSELQPDSGKTAYLLNDSEKMRKTNHVSAPPFKPDELAEQADYDGNSFGA